MTPIHARWRLYPVHLVAKLFGVLAKVEGIPIGSNRTMLANPPRKEDVAGAGSGYSFGNTKGIENAATQTGYAELQRQANTATNLPIDRPASVGVQSCGSTSNGNSLFGANRNQDRAAMIQILTGILVPVTASSHIADGKDAAVDAVKAFKLAMAEFDQLAMLPASPAESPPSEKTMAEKLESIRPHLDKAVDFELKSHERLRQLQRLADAAADIPLKVLSEARASENQDPPKPS